LAWHALTYRTSYHWEEVPTRRKQRCNVSDLIEGHEKDNNQENHSHSSRR
jgi:hypothetical protein